MVRIDTTLNFQGAEGTGAGVVLSPDGVVLTNNHVIRGADGITVTNIGTGRAYQADVLGYDRKSDIAVLQLRGASDLPVAPMATRRSSAWELPWSASAFLAAVGSPAHRAGSSHSTRASWPTTTWTVPPSS